MAEPISVQQLKDASEDAISLADFINKPENVMIPRRLASDINSLQYYLEYMKSFAQRSYETYDEMVANASNLSDNVSALVTNDSDTSKNGIYTYNGTSFVKGEYQPENVAKEFVESKLGGLEVFDGKVRAQDVSTADGSTQEVKNTEFRNELDELPPFEGGVLADTFVTATAQSPTRIARTQHQKNSDVVSVKDFGAKGDSVTDDSDAIQANVDWTEANKVPYVFVPTTQDNYFLTKPLMFREAGIKLFGNKGVTYGRGTGKHGNLLLAAGVSHAIDFGADLVPTSGVPYNEADSFSLEDLGVIRAMGVPLEISQGNHDGIRFTAKHDGPHRGGSIRGFSAAGLNRAIHIPNPDNKSTSYANLHIENCCLSENMYALYSDGNVQGLRFVGNQAEQNVLGAVHGTFASHVYIADNMLEGQYNPINITNAGGHFVGEGSRARLTVTGNYLEANNSGDYIIRFASTIDCIVDVQKNYSFDFNQSKLDYLLISNESPVLVTNKDDKFTTFDGLSTILPDSDILNRSIRGYKIANTSPYNLHSFYTTYNFAHLADNPENPHKHYLMTNGTRSRTPLGLLPTWSLSSTFFNNPVVGEIGDVVAFNILLKAGGAVDFKQGEFINRINFISGGTTIAEWDLDVTSIANDRWMLVTIPLVLASKNPSIIIKFTNIQANEYGAVAAVAVKNYGQFPTNPSDPKFKSRIVIEPCCPVAPFYELTQEFTSTSIASGQAQTKDITIPDVHFYEPARINVQSGYSVALPNDLIMTSTMKSETVVTVSIRNTGTTAQTLPAGTANVLVRQDF